MRLDWASFFLFTGFFFHSAAAHYIFRTLLTSTGSSDAAVRRPAENSPIHDITSSGATCNVGLSPATETVSVSAGSLIGFKLGAGTTVFHKGPAAMYLGKAPERAADWDGSGQNWFKIAEWGATFNPFSFASLGKDTFTSTIPSSVPSGEYLVRIEQIGLHLTGSPELFVSCAQIKITGGGSATPSKFSIPGYIARDDPMLTLNIYWPQPTAYTVPGPAVYSDLQSPARPSESVDSTTSWTAYTASQPSPVPSPSVIGGNQTLPSKPILCRHRRRRQHKSSIPVGHLRRRSH